MNSIKLLFRRLSSSGRTDRYSRRSKAVGRIHRHVQGLQQTLPLSGEHQAPLPHLVGTTVRIPSTGLLSKASMAASVLMHPALVVTRQIEMLNVLVGYEQANKYAIKDPSGSNVGFIVEEEASIGGLITRQLLRTRRPFNAVIMDNKGRVVLRIERPIKLFLNSQMVVIDPESSHIVGQVRQSFHVWRRRYDLFVDGRQFADIDGQFLAFDFPIHDERLKPTGEITRNFMGFAREIFTDTGQYAILMDPKSHRPLSLDERAICLACAVNIDIDYFSRHSHSGGVMFPFIGGSNE